VIDARLLVAVDHRNACRLHPRQINGVAGDPQRLDPIKSWNPTAFAQDRFNRVIVLVERCWQQIEQPSRELQIEHATMRDVDHGSTFQLLSDDGVGVAATGERGIA
jgi:hypothetical protein